MNEQLSLRRYRRDCLLGMLGGMLMLANAIWAGRQIKREENVTKGIRFEVGYDLSELDIETLRAGGTLNLIRAQQ